MAKRNKSCVRMDAQTAMDIAESMDLPDGAHFAMVGELMGGDYMTGIDAYTGAKSRESYPVELLPTEIKALSPFGDIVRHDYYHYQIRNGKVKVADFWPLSRVKKWRLCEVSGPAQAGGPMDLAKALRERAAAEVTAIQPGAKAYLIGPLTHEHVFKVSGLTNVHDWQAVLNAVEAALSRIKH